MEACARYWPAPTNRPLQVVLKSADKNDSNLAREIHHHRQFVHPHIARLYEVIVTENLVWMVLEYCAGTSLHLPLSISSAPPSTGS